MDKSEDLRGALAEVARTQAAFWDAMSEFEELADVELNSVNQDFTVFQNATDEGVEYVLKHCVEGADAERLDR